MFDPEGPSSYGTVLFCFCSVSPFLSPMCPQKTSQAQAAAPAVLDSLRLTSHSKFPINRVGTAFLLSLHGSGPRWGSTKG